MYTRITNHIHLNHSLTPHQSGFREHFSTEQAIFSLINYILEAMNKHQSVAGMFCDLHKAFDSVNHQILPKKLQFYGIRGKMEVLIQSYLVDRYQKVICDDTFSSWEPVQCVISQGSILGPLLSLIYINELPSIMDTKNNTMLLYADDTSIVIT
jgi:hypothetical protein